MHPHDSPELQDEHDAVGDHEDGEESRLPLPELLQLRLAILPYECLWALFSEVTSDPKRSDHLQPSRTLRLGLRPHRINDDLPALGRALREQAMHPLVSPPLVPVNDNQVTVHGHQAPYSVLRRVERQSHVGIRYLVGIAGHQASYTLGVDHECGAAQMPQVARCEQL